VSFLVCTPAHARVLRRALRCAEGLPVRVESSDQTTYPSDLKLDDSGDPVAAPGWITEATGEYIEAGDLAALEILPALERHLAAVIMVDGQAVEMPTEDELVEEADLPPELQGALAARRERSKHV